MRRWLFLPLLLLFVFPASTNYQLQNYGFGSGGGTPGSTNYDLQGVAGQLAGDALTSTNYQTWPGVQWVQQAGIPGAPTLTNDGNDYNQLQLIIDTGGNPSDAEFAIAVSTDGFTTTNYLQADATIGATLGSEDWQTYADWGSGTGTTLAGLDPDTTYSVKVRARHGNFTETGWGPVTNTDTSALSLSFDIDVASTDTESAAPYTLSLGNLVGDTIVTSTDRVWIDLVTNAVGGGQVYVYGTNSGLYSSITGHTIAAVSGNLTSLSEGFGLQYASLGQTSGGPMAVASPYNGTSETIGTVTTAPQVIFTSSSDPVVAGRASFVAKAKITPITPPAGDYTDTLVVIAAATF